MILSLPSACRRAEARARELLSLSEDLQMERASLLAWSFFQELFPGHRTFAVPCGPGSNGGDGLALARHALLDGFRPIVHFPGSEPAPGGLAALQLSRLRALGIHPASRAELVALPPDVPAVDALFGTGLSRGLSGEFAEASAWLSVRPTLALDLPSGLDGATGRPFDGAVRALATITFGRAKPGLFLDPGREFSGEVRVADIGIPSCCWEGEESLALMDSQWARGCLPRRARGAHKGSAGQCVLLCGSSSYPGALTLSASGALRSGAGLVLAATTAELAASVVQAIPEVLGRTAIGPGHEPISRILTKADAVLAGPGLGQGDDAIQALAGILESWEGPLVLDADALNLLASRPDLRDLLRGRKGSLVLTPHPAEAARLLGTSAEELLQDPIESARRLSLEFQAVAVFKTATPVIASPDGELALGVAGHPGMAVGGCGDALAGAVVARLAEGESPFRATCQAVRAHARAGEIAGERGHRGMSVTDLLSALPTAWEEMEQELQVEHLR